MEVPAVGVGPGTEVDAVIALVLLGAVIAAVVYAVTHRHGAGSPVPQGGEPAGTAPPGSLANLPPPPPTAALVELLGRWRDAGLLSESEAAAIVTFEEARLAETRAAWVAAPPTAVARPRRVPVVAEALGYLGAALAVGGLGLVLGRLWPDWSVGARLALTGVVAVVLGGAGFAVRDLTEPALARLQAVVWLASTAATGLFAGVLVRDGFTESEAGWVALGVALAVALQSGALWRGDGSRPVQQFSCLVGAIVTVGTATAQLAPDGSAGLAVLAAGVALLVVGLRRVLASPGLVELVGGVGALAGAMVTTNEWPAAGLLLTLAVALGLLAVATVPGLAPERPDRLVTGVLGGVALVQAAPSVLGYFAQDAGVATGLVAWVLGAGLVAVGARRLVLVPHVATALGAGTVLVGAAVTGAQSQGLATTFGIATALGLVALGMRPGQVLLSVFGSLGLLGFVPWAISWFFPGEGRVPVLLVVSGVLIIAIAVLLGRLAPRLRTDLGSPPGGRGPTRPPPAPPVARPPRPPAGPPAVSGA